MQFRESPLTQNVVCQMVLKCLRGKLTMISEVENEVLLFYISVVREGLFDKVKIEQIIE